MREIAATLAHVYPAMFRESRSGKILAQAAFRAPPEVAFAMRSWPLLLPVSLSFSLFLWF